MLETNTLRVEADEERVRIFRKTGADDPIAELRGFSPEGATVMVDRGYAAYGLGGNNAWRFKSQEDIDELVDVDLSRWGYEYRIHHRYTGQGNNFFPWVLSAQGFGLFFDSSFPMTIDLRDGFSVSGKNIRTFYFIDGPSTTGGRRALAGHARRSSAGGQSPGNRYDRRADLRDAEPGIRRSRGDRG